MKPYDLTCCTDVEIRAWSGRRAYLSCSEHFRELSMENPPLSATWFVFQLICRKVVEHNCSIKITAVPPRRTVSLGSCLHWCRCRLKCGREDFAPISKMLRPICVNCNRGKTLMRWSLAGIEPGAGHEQGLNVTGTLSRSPLHRKSYN
jgi:hypothetical protein